MKPIKKLFDLKRKKEKREKKAKKARHLLGLCCAFFLGAGLTSFFIFKNREKLAVMTLGRWNVRSGKLRKIRRRKNR